MIMSYFWSICAIISAFCCILFRTGSETGAALIEGAANAIAVCVSIAGPLALWSGLGNLMERLGITGVLAKLLSPVLGRLFPSSREDSALAGDLSANVCANLLGLGNAATPMGIRAVRRLQDRSSPKTATDEMCRLVVMNTASIQLIPSTVAAVRASAGCEMPFDILPCVWVSSILSVSAGLAAAYILRRFWPNE